MYKCIKCGDITKSEWCDRCKTIVECDCEDMITTRFKDLKYDCKNGERTITLHLRHCNTCGEVLYVEL